MKLSFFLALVAISCTSVYEQQRQMIQDQTTREFEELDLKCSMIKIDAGSEGLIAQELSECLAVGECTDQFISRLSLRYEMADYQRVSLMIDAYPDLYSTPEAVELLILESHNSNVDAFCNEQRIQIASDSNDAIAEVNQKEQEHIQRTIDAINQSIDSSNSDVETNCYNDEDKTTCYTKVK